MTVIKFGAEWCQPCQRLAPLLAKSAENNPEVIFVDVDIEEDRDVVGEWGIAGIPTVVILDDEGNEVKRATGNAAAEILP